jgi:hypothetical protein
MSYKLLAILLIFTLVACQPAAVQPTPARQTIQAAFTPTLSWIGPLMNNCSRLYALDVLIHEVPTAQLADSQADLVFSWGSDPAGTGVAYQMGNERLAVIVNPQNGLSQITLAQLKGIYDQSIQTWGELQAGQDNNNLIDRWSFPDQQDTRLVMESTITIRDSGFSPLWLAPDPHAMRQAVASNPLAIGYLPHNWLDGSVKEIPILGENQDNITLEQPLFMVQSSTLQVSQDWLVCVQQGIAASQ